MLFAVADDVEGSRLRRFPRSITGELRRQKADRSVVGHDSNLLKAVWRKRECLRLSFKSLNLYIRIVFLLHCLAGQFAAHFRIDIVVPYKVHSAI